MTKCKRHRLSGRWTKRQRRGGVGVAMVGGGGFGGGLWVGGAGVVAAAGADAAGVGRVGDVEQARPLTFA